jgi:hypothetical protein
MNALSASMFALNSMASGSIVAAIEQACPITQHQTMDEKSMSHEHTMRSDVVTGSISP